MEQVLRRIADYQWWIYGVLGLMMLFYLRRAILARREGARSIFKLEQEQARTRYGRSVMLLTVILIIMAAVFLLSNPLLPVPTETPSPTPTSTNGPLVAPTLTPTPAPATITPISAFSVTAAPTSTSTSALTIRTIPGATTPGIHVVKLGDSIYAISVAYGTTVDAIREANGLESNSLRVGQELIIPVGTVTPLPTSTTMPAATPTQP